jgi:hypothetical protein
LFNREAVTSFSPTLPLRLRWVTSAWNHTNRKAVASVPNIFFIPFDAMPRQQRPNFILKIDFSMMLFLIGNLSFDVLKV